MKHGTFFSLALPSKKGVSTGLGFKDPKNVIRKLMVGSTH